LAYFLSKDAKSESILSHLKEFCSKFSELFAALLKNKLQKLLQILQGLTTQEQQDLSSLNQTILDSLDKYLKQLKESQIMYLRVLESPMCKLLPLLEQICTHTYSLSSVFLTSDFTSKYILDILELDIMTMESVSKAFNPAITSCLLKLIKYSDY